MGRRYRRKQRKERNVSEYGKNASHESIEFIRWLHNLGWNPNTNLRLSFFSSTGRGLMALSPIESNSLIIRVPYEFVITRSKAQCQTNDTRTTHDVLAQFLTQESALREASKWFFYIKSLPSSYDVPFFIPEDEALNALPSFWREPVLEQKERLKNSLTNAWAYFTVNTRAVYHSDGGMALIPFLDMFNHSPHVSVSINEARDGSFEIISGPHCVRKFDQVFINYGPHSNIKLFLEYGFWIANNPHDAIPITLSELTSVLLEGKGMSTLRNNDSKKLTLLKDNKIDQNMCLAITSSKIHETKEESASLASPSWNIYACFDILKRDDASSLVYSQIYRDNLEMDNRDLVISLMKNKLRELKASANALKNSFNHIRSCCMASELLFTYVCAIESALALFK
ncbi:SET domain-containing protein 4 [Lepeophtheirus salmonis]|uniref:SET domain-containing protein n=1 Tax=Lepeophtheirus salmonis TaxID=72036 RepID=A0A0K2UEF9_LEPSM|nr:SET domain-containing protein 4-like [Lepeophtheirus salmonis]